MGAHLTIGHMHIALSIAASDPTGGAGLQADLQIFRQLGVHGAGVVTAPHDPGQPQGHRVLPVFLANGIFDLEFIKIVLKALKIE